MRKVLVTAGALFCGLYAAEALACGDKFLVVGRAPRAQRARGAVQKAAILMYLDPAGDLRQAIKEEGLETDLKLAGHSVRYVTDRRTLGEELRAQPYDIVIAGVADLESLDLVVRAAPSRPSLLPIVYEPTPEELEAARKRFECVMRSPGRKQSYLAVIEDAMMLRQKRAHAQPMPKEER